MRKAGSRLALSVIAAGLLGACGVEAAAPEAPVAKATAPLTTLSGLTLSALCMEASDEKNAGTNDWIRLDYLTEAGDQWHCELNGISRAERRCCDASKVSNVGTQSFDSIYAGYVGGSHSDDDAFAVGTISVITSDLVEYSRGRFSAARDVREGGCGLTDCARFWVDTGHANTPCGFVKVNMGGGAMWCMW